MINKRYTYHHNYILDKMGRSNEVFERVIDLMLRCKAEEDAANEGIMSTVASSLIEALNVMIYQLKLMIGDYNVSNSIAMRRGEECSSILGTNRDKLHCLISKVIGYLKGFINYIYETIERLPASKVEGDMIKRTIISNDLLFWLSSISDSDRTEEDKVSSGVVYSADDSQVMEGGDDAGLDMAQRRSRTCSNDESSGLKSDEQTSTPRDNDSPQPALVFEDEITRMYIEGVFDEYHSKDGGGDGGDSEDGSLDSDQTGEDKEASSGVAYPAEDSQVMEEGDDADLDMAQRRSRTCSNDESSGLKSDEQTSTTRDNDSSQPAVVSEDESKHDGLSLSMSSLSLGEHSQFSLGEHSQFSLCLSKDGQTAVDTATEWLPLDDLPDHDLGDCCSRSHPPQTSIDHLIELAGRLRDKLQSTRSLPQPDVSEFIKTLLRLPHGEIFRALTKYQRGLNTVTLNGTDLLRELSQGSAWLQASTPMLYMGWADFETYDLSQILATNLYCHQKELESKISTFLECDWTFTDIIHFLLFTFACKTYLWRDDGLPFQSPSTPLPGEQDLRNHVVVVEAILDGM